jgi:hypothetical protein
MDEVLDLGRVLHLMGQLIRCLFEGETGPEDDAICLLEVGERFL